MKRRNDSRSFRAQGKKAPQSRHARRLLLEGLDDRRMMALVFSDWGTAPIKFEGEYFEPGEGIYLRYTLEETASVLPFGEAIVMLSEDATIDAGDYPLDVNETDPGLEAVGLLFATRNLPAASHEFYDRGTFPEDGVRTYYVGVLFKNFDAGTETVYVTEAIPVKVEKPDLKVTSVIAQNGYVTVNYSLKGAPPEDKFNLRFIASSNSRYETNDQVLDEVTIEGDDAIPGDHSIQFPIGTGDDAISLPGLLGVPTNQFSDYYILAVADTSDLFQENDSHPHHEDNTGVLYGVYEANGVVYVHGSQQKDVASLTESGGGLTLAGTGFELPAGRSYYELRLHSGDDELSFQLGSEAFMITNVWGGPGNDTAINTLSLITDKATLSPGGAVLASADARRHLNISGFTKVTAKGKGGEVVFRDSAADDVLVMRRNQAIMEGDGFENAAEDFLVVKAIARGAANNDVAIVIGTPEADRFEARSRTSTFAGPGMRADLRDFKIVKARGGLGADEALLYGTSAVDRATSKVEYVQLASQNYGYEAAEFEKVTAYAGTGDDRADMYDTSGDDRFEATPSSAKMKPLDGSFEHSANGFDRVYARAQPGGDDTADLRGSDKNDVFRGTPESSQLSSSDPKYFNSATGFDKVFANAGSAGEDTANFFDSEADDTFRILYSNTTGSIARLWNDDYQLNATAFDRNIASGSGGSDKAYFYDSVAKQEYSGSATYGMLTGNGLHGRANNFDEYVVTQSSAGTVDTAALTDSAENDTFTARPDDSIMRYGSGALHHLRRYKQVTVTASEGYDRATFFDTAAFEEFITEGSSAKLTSTAFTLAANGFDSTKSISSGGGDTARMLGTGGDDDYTGKAFFGMLSGVGYQHIAEGYKLYAIQGLAHNSNDRAFLTDSVSNDTITIASNNFIDYQSGQGYAHRLSGFERSSTTSNGGSDSMTIEGAGGNYRASALDSSTLYQRSGVNHSSMGFLYTSCNLGGAGSVVLVGTALSDSFLGVSYYGSLRTSKGHQYDVTNMDSVVLETGDGGNDTYTSSVLTYNLTPKAGWTLG